MQLMQAPKRFYWLLLLLVFCSAPAVCLEVILAREAPWWELPYWHMGVWSFAFFLLSLWFVYRLRQLRAGSVYLLFAAGVLWIAVTLGQAIAKPRTGLIFFALMLFAGLLSWALLFAQEIKRAYFSSKKRWYQGLPKPLPSLRCRVGRAGQFLEAQVADLDSLGIFLFLRSGSDGLPRRNFLQLPKETRVEPGLELQLVFQDHVVSCLGRLICRNALGSEAGFEWINLRGDERKQFNDLLEDLMARAYLPHGKT